MPLFIFYTTCAMMMRWVPGVKEVDFGQNLKILIFIWYLLPGAFYWWFSYFMLWNTQIISNHTQMYFIETNKFDNNKLYLINIAGAFLDASILLASNLCLLVVSCNHLLIYLGGSHIVVKTWNWTFDFLEKSVFSSFWNTLLNMNICPFPPLLP